MAVTSGTGISLCGFEVRAIVSYWGKSEYQMPPGGGEMRKSAIAIIVGLAVVAGSFTPVAFADGTVVRRSSKKVRHVTPAIRCDRCGVPITCPDGFCASIYGAYGPYGGSAYWSRYSYQGWSYR